MRNIENAEAAPYSFTEGVTSWIDIDTLSKLLAAASASVDNDIVAAKDCIRRAEELLDSCCSQRQRLFQDRPTARGGLAPWRKSRVVAYIEANLASHIRPSDLAEILRLSTGHFFRAFRESFGEAPLAYVARQRIRRSQALMLNSRATLAQIALDCGMCDQAHFTRVFRRIVGHSPSVWRREFAGNVRRSICVSGRPMCSTAGAAAVHRQNEHALL